MVAGRSAPLSENGIRFVSQNSKVTPEIKGKKEVIQDRKSNNAPDVADNVTRSPHSDFVDLPHGEKLAA
jgi:hypothetical protein